MLLQEKKRKEKKRSLMVGEEKVYDILLCVN
jgi:hypothetical protein